MGEIWFVKKGEDGSWRRNRDWLIPSFPPGWWRPLSTLMPPQTSSSLLTVWQGFYNFNPIKYHPVFSKTTAKHRLQNYHLKWISDRGQDLLGFMQFWMIWSKQIFIERPLVFKNFLPKRKIDLYETNIIHHNLSKERLN